MKNSKKLSAGDLIAYYRKKSNIKQDQLACELGIAQSKISDWENDKISPSVKELISLAGILHMNPAQLIPQSDIGSYEFNKNSENSETTFNENKNTSYIEEERKAYKETLFAKDEALRVKDEIIAELRKISGMSAILP